MGGEDERHHKFSKCFLHHRVAEQRANYHLLPSALFPLTQRAQPILLFLTCDLSMRMLLFIFTFYLSPIFISSFINRDFTSIYSLQFTMSFLHLSAFVLRVTLLLPPYIQRTSASIAGCNNTKTAWLSFHLYHLHSSSCVCCNSQYDPIKTLSLCLLKVVNPTTYWIFFSLRVCAYQQCK